MAAQQCRESERLHGIICCYIGFAFSPPANSRQATLPGAVPCKAAFGPALQHVITLSWHAPRMLRIMALLPQKRYGRGRYSVVTRESIPPLNYNG